MKPWGDYTQVDRPSLPTARRRYGSTMAPPRVTRARLAEVAAFREAETAGVLLTFRPEGRARAPERIEDVAELGPELTVETVSGVSKVLRILRAARVAAPRDPLALVGLEDEAAALLTRAIDAPLRLSYRPRSRLSFKAWTEQGVETIHDVAEVRDEGDEVIVVRRGERRPVRFDRETLVRRQTELEPWVEVLDIERA